MAEDKAEAVKWYTKASEQGYAQAQNDLGYCYDLGTAVPEDKAEAVKWHRKAPGQDHAEAQNHLGYCYNHGIVEPPRRFYWLEASFFGQLLDSIPLRSIYFSES